MSPVVFLSLTMVLASSAGLAEEGLWRAETAFSQVNVFCIMVYTCGPANDIMHSGDTKVVSTSPKVVRGVCSAGTGPIDSCNLCLTNPPPDKCEWHLTPK
jgi:hypothetical protein